MSEQNPVPKQTVVFAGTLGEAIHTEQPDGRIFERWRRPPGTRLVIVSPENKMLITREYRAETGGVDVRLPGGKVCDDLDSYHALLASGEDLTVAAGKAAAKEALEETGLVVRNPQLIVKANAGATVDWDLYYFLIKEYEQHSDGQHLEQGEQIEVGWMTPAEIRQAAAQGQMQEWRSVGVLLGMVLPQLETND